MSKFIEKLRDESGQVDSTVVRVLAVIALVLVIIWLFAKVV